MLNCKCKEQELEIEEGTRPPKSKAGKRRYSLIRADKEVNQGSELKSRAEKGEQMEKRAAEQAGTRE